MSYWSLFCWWGEKRISILRKLFFVCQAILFERQSNRIACCNDDFGVCVCRKGVLLTKIRFMSHTQKMHTRNRGKSPTLMLFLVFKIRICPRLDRHWYDSSTVSVILKVSASEIFLKIYFSFYDIEDFRNTNLECDWDGPRRNGPTSMLITDYENFQKRIC